MLSADLVRHVLWHQHALAGPTHFKHYPVSVECWASATEAVQLENNVVNLVNMSILSRVMPKCVTSCGGSFGYVEK